MPQFGQRQTDPDTTSDEYWNEDYSVTGDIYYVSLDGLNSYNGKSPKYEGGATDEDGVVIGPFRNIWYAAQDKLSSGDALCLRRGDTFAQDGFGAWSTSNVLITSYFTDEVGHEATTDAPKIQASVDKNTLHPTVSLSNIDFVDIHFDGGSSVGGNARHGIDWVDAQGSNITFEGCIFDSYKYGVYIQGHPSNPIENLRFSRCVFLDAYDETGADSWGAYFSRVNTLIIQRCVFDHNGWSASPVVPRALNSGNLFIDKDCVGYIIVTNTTSSRGACDGIRVLADGTIHYSLSVENAVGISYGYTPDDPTNHKSLPVSGSHSSYLWGTGNYLGYAWPGSIGGCMIMGSQDLDLTGPEGIKGVGMYLGNVDGLTVKNTSLLKAETNCSVGISLVGPGLTNTVIIEKGYWFDWPRCIFDKDGSWDSPVSDIANCLFYNPTGGFVSGLSAGQWIVGHKASTSSIWFGNTSLSGYSNIYQWWSNQYWVPYSENLMFAFWDNVDINTFSGSDNNSWEFWSDFSNSEFLSSEPTVTDVDLGDFWDDVDATSGSTVDDFITQIRAQRRGFGALDSEISPATWNDEIEAFEAINWIRDNHGLSQFVGS